MDDLAKEDVLDAVVRVLGIGPISKAARIACLKAITHAVTPITPGLPGRNAAWCRCGEPLVTGKLVCYWGSIAEGPK